jgi:hypothetical protein
MTIITINERTTKGKSLVEFLRKFDGEGFVEIEKEPTASLKESMEEAKAGKINKYKSSEDLFKKLRKKNNV